MVVMALPALNTLFLRSLVHRLKGILWSWDWRPGSSSVVVKPVLRESWGCH